VKYEVKMDDEKTVAIAFTVITTILFFVSEILPLTESPYHGIIQMIVEIVKNCRGKETHKTSDVVQKVEVKPQVTIVQSDQDEDKE